MLTKTPHLFDDATQVTAGDSRWQGQTSGITGPLSARSAAHRRHHPAGADRSSASARRDPLAMTVNYCAPIAEGGFDLDLRLVKANRSRSTGAWR